jgi:hypothetical protein
MIVHPNEQGRDSGGFCGVGCLNNGESLSVAMIHEMKEDVGPDDMVSGH